MITGWPPPGADMNSPKKLHGRAAAHCCCSSSQITGKRHCRQQCHQSRRHNSPFEGRQRLPLHKVRSHCTRRQRHLRCSCFTDPLLVAALLTIWLNARLELAQAQPLVVGLISVTCSRRENTVRTRSEDLVSMQTEGHAVRSSPCGHVKNPAAPEGEHRRRLAETQVCRLAMQASSCGRNSGPPSSAAMSSCRSARAAAVALTATSLLIRNPPLACSGVTSACCTMCCCGCASTSPATVHAHSRLAAVYALRHIRDTCIAATRLHHTVKAVRRGDEAGSHKFVCSGGCSGMQRYLGPAAGVQLLPTGVHTYLGCHVA
jgi:hypothetical protein